MSPRYACTRTASPQKRINGSKILSLSRIIVAQVLALGARSRCHNEAHNQAVQTKSLREDENKDHAHEETWLLSVRAHARITNDADGKACRQGTHADGQPGAQMCKARVCGVLAWVRQLAIDDDRCDETVDAQDASHYPM